VRVVDPQPAPAGAFRPIALSHASRLIFERIGAWGDFPVTPITTIHVSQAGAFGRTRLDAADAGVPALGYVTEVTMREALCAQMSVNFFDLDHIALDPALAKLINEKYALKRRVVPILRAEGILVVAVDDPADVMIVEDLQRLVRLRVEIVTSTVEKIQRAFTRLYRAGPGPNVAVDPHPNIMIGAVHDPEVADLVARVLKVKILPPC